MSELIKRHKGCGGEVVWREPSKEAMPQAWFKRAGFCLKCGTFPINIEDIVNFEE